MTAQQTDFTRLVTGAHDTLSVLKRRPRQQARRATATRKVKGTVHWVSAAHAVDAEVRLYDRLFTGAEPEKDGRDFRASLNPRSLEVVTARCEPSLKQARAEDRYQFERLGYFCMDSQLSVLNSQPEFNRTITLRDTWAKEAQKG